MSIPMISWAATLEDKVREGCLSRSLSAHDCQKMIEECQRMQQIEQLVLVIHFGAVVLGAIALWQLTRMVLEVHRTRGIRAALRTMNAVRLPIPNKIPLAERQRTWR